MATTLSGLTATLRVKLSVVAEKAQDLTTPVEALDYVWERDYTFGSGVGEVDLLWHDERTVAASETVDLNCLVDSFGDTPSFTNVKVLIIENLSTNDADCVFSIGNHAANQFDTWLGGATEVIKLYPGEAKVLISRGDANGYNSAAGDHNLLITNAGVNPAVCRIVVLGESI